MHYSINLALNGFKIEKPSIKYRCMKSTLYILFNDLTHIIIGEELAILFSPEIRKCSFFLYFFKHGYHISVTVIPNMHFKFRHVSGNIYMLLYGGKRCLSILIYVLVIVLWNVENNSLKKTLKVSPF